MKDVEFENVVYTVTTGKNRFVKERQKQYVLKGVSGSFKHGQLSGIMGPSGAGKSSLLNAISGLRTAGVEGVIRVNKKQSCYITQEDLHQPLMTVLELMQFACKLKLRASVKYKYDTVIDEVLANLHLSHRKTVTADRLSGGERKRLSIALELVANPSVFFLDEPTTGLDEVTAAQTVRQLKELAMQDRTVVCTIHQPSATVFDLLDHIYIIAQGQCVYQGSPKALVPFLNAVNIACPTYYNPADFIIELCDTEDSQQIIQVFSSMLQNGKAVCGTVNTEPLYRLRPTFVQSLQEKPKEKMDKVERTNSELQQFVILFQMMMLKILRNRTALYVQFFHHLICGFFIGAIFFQLANDGDRMFDHLKFCMGAVFFTVYTQLMVPILSYPFEIKLVKKEYFNRWYKLVPYYLALTCSRLPLQFLFTVMFSALVYFLSGLPLELWRFTGFTLVGIITGLVADGLGLLIGATFSVTNGSAVGPMCIAPFLGLAAYGFDFAEKIPLFMDILMRLSFIRGGIVSMVLVVFGFNRQQLNCSDIYCHFDDPTVLLRYLRIENRTLWGEFLVLGAICLLFRTLLYMSLRKRCSA